MHQVLTSPEFWIGVAATIAILATAALVLILAVPALDAAERDVIAHRDARAKAAELAEVAEHQLRPLGLSPRQTQLTRGR